MPTGAITRSAPAKLNLMLSVGDALPEGHEAHPAGKAEFYRAGYHLISSWFACIDLHDDVEVAPRAKGACTDDAQRWASVVWASDAHAVSPIDWPLDNDLGVRAARLLEQHVGKPLAVSMQIRKRIAVGGGLGGGSSNAASVLLALRDACTLSVNDDALVQLGEHLGSDVAYFVRCALENSDGNSTIARGAIVEGLGEAIEPLACPASSLVLITCAAPCSTREVYAKYDELRMLRRAELAGEGKKPRPYDGPRSETVRRRAEEIVAAQRLNERQLFNDLELAALRTQPLLGPLKTALGKITRRLVHITGSGSSMFIVPEVDAKHDQTAWTLERAQRVCAGEAGAGVQARARVVRVGVA